MYALKTVSRNKVTKFDLVKYLMLERDIMLQLDHQLIIKLVKTFKDENRIYFLTEFVRGTDLFNVLVNIGIVRE